MALLIGKQIHIDPDKRKILTVDKADVRSRAARSSRNYVISASNRLRSIDLFSSLKIRRNTLPRQVLLPSGEDGTLNQNPIFEMGSSKILAVQQNGAYRLRF